MINVEVCALVRKWIMTRCAIDHKYPDTSMAYHFLTLSPLRNLNSQPLHHSTMNTNQASRDRAIPEEVLERRQVLQRLPIFIGGLFGGLSEILIDGLIEGLFEGLFEGLIESLFGS